MKIEKNKNECIKIIWDTWYIIFPFLEKQEIIKLREVSTAYKTIIEKKYKESIKKFLFMGNYTYCKTYFNFWDNIDIKENLQVKWSGERYYIFDERTNGELIVHLSPMELFYFDLDGVGCWNVNNIKREFDGVKNKIRLQCSSKNRCIQWLKELELFVWSEIQKQKKITMEPTSIIEKELQKEEKIYLDLFWNKNKGVFYNENGDEIIINSSNIGLIENNAIVYVDVHFYIFPQNGTLMDILLSIQTMQNNDNNNNNQEKIVCYNDYFS